MFVYVFVCMDACKVCVCAWCVAFFGVCVCAAPLVCARTSTCIYVPSMSQKPKQATPIYPKKKDV
jgi:hypothetical protein